MAIITTCCFCFSTRSGTIALGVLCLVVGFCASVGLCFGLINVDMLAHDMTTNYDMYKMALFTNMTEPRYQLVDNLIGFENIIKHVRIIFIVCLVFYALYTFSALFMAYGSCTGLKSLLLPWIVMEFVPFGIQVTVIIVMFVFGKDDPTLSKGGAYIIAGILNIMAFVIHVYWWMCPVAHYQSLKEETMIEALVPPNHPMYPAVLMKY